MSSALLPLLAELGCLYPELRFGQLFEMVASLSEDVASPGSEAHHDRLVHAASEHLSHRLGQLGLDRGQLTQRSIAPVRGDLLRMLYERQQRAPAQGLGQVLQGLAEQADALLYDAEDHQLLLAGQERAPVTLAELLPRVSGEGRPSELTSATIGGTS